MTATDVTTTTVSGTCPVCAGPEKWASLAPAGFSRYAVSNKGVIARVTPAGYRPLARGKNSSGPRPYYTAKAYNDDGKRETWTVQRFVLTGWVGPRPEGKEACHRDDDPAHNCIDPDNPGISQLRWDWPSGNRQDRQDRQPPKPPKPPRRCVRCDAAFTGNGRRCHDCVVWFGTEAARLLRSGASLDKTAKQLGYPSPEGLHTLAVRYGGYARPPWTRRVKVTLRNLFRRGRDR